MSGELAAKGEGLRLQAVLASSPAGRAERRARAEGPADALEILVDRLRRGDQRALEALIERTRARAFHLAFAFVGDRHLCQDVLQDVYLTVFQQVGKLRDLSAFPRWFARILRNRCRRVLRRRRPDSLDQLVTEGGGPHTAGMAEQAGARLALERAMGRLEERHRVVLRLRAVLQLSYQEIASGGVPRRPTGR